jgi:hypothetical protein
MVFGLFRKKGSPTEPLPPAPPARLPPVPDWRPDIAQPIDRICDRVRYYANGTKDFVVFSHGTFVILDPGLSDEQAAQTAKEALHKVFHAHPDMNPDNMDDGNILVRYSNMTCNVVLSDIVEAHWAEIDRRHQQALATHEVLVTQLGPNRFDDFGKKALFGRCYMFMDAQDPKVVRIERRTAN